MHLIREIEQPERPGSPVRVWALALQQDIAAFFDLDRREWREDAVRVTGSDGSASHDQTPVRYA